MPSLSSLRGEESKNEMKEKGGGGIILPLIKWGIIITIVIIVLVVFVPSILNMGGEFWGRISSMPGFKNLGNQLKMIQYVFSSTSGTEELSNIYGGQSSKKVSQYSKVSQKEWEGPSTSTGIESHNMIELKDFSLTRTKFPLGTSTMAQLIVENTGKSPVKPANVKFRSFSGEKLGTNNFNFNCDGGIPGNSIRGGTRLQVTCEDISPNDWACYGYEDHTRSFLIEALFDGGYHSTARLDLNYIQEDYADTLFKAGELELEEKDAINSGGPVVVGVMGPKQPISDKRDSVTLSFAMDDKGSGSVNKGNVYMIVGMPNEIFKSSKDFNCFSSVAEENIATYDPKKVGDCEELFLGKRSFSKGIKSNLVIKKDPYKGYVFCPAFDCSAKECEGPGGSKDGCKDPIVYDDFSINLEDGSVAGKLSFKGDPSKSQVSFMAWYYGDRIAEETFTPSGCDEGGVCELSEQGIGFPTPSKEKDEQGPYFIQVAVNNSCGDVYIATRAKWDFQAEKTPSGDQLYLPEEVSEFYMDKLAGGDWTVCLKSDARTASYNIRTEVPDLEMLRRMKSVRTDLIYRYQKRIQHGVKVIC